MSTPKERPEAPPEFVSRRYEFPVPLTDEFRAILRERVEVAWRQHVWASLATQPRWKIR